MAPDLTSAAGQSSYELGCILRACGEVAQDHLPDQAPLLAALARRLSPILPPTDVGLDFAKAIEPRLYNPDQPETFAALWAVLLSDALQQGIVLDLMDPDLARLPDLTRGLGQARRSAILRAADVYLKQRQMTDTLGLTGQDRFSLPPDAVITPLADLARSATEEDIRAIAIADLGAFQIETDHALRALLADPECRMPEKGDRWHPAEGLSLTSHSPGKPGFLVSTALMLVDDIHHDGGYDFSEFRWQRRHSVYQDLPEPWRTPILCGFRHMMEFFSPLDWGTVGILDLGQDASADIRETGLIPWFDDPATA